jgi:hypothetical protein
VNVTPLTNLEARKRPLDSGGAKKKTPYTAAITEEGYPQFSGWSVAPLESGDMSG